MVVEVNSRSKTLYKVQLYLLKVVPYSEEAAILSGELAMQILNEALYNIAEL